MIFEVLPRFTEVGFHGRDVDQIIQDLVADAVRRRSAIPLREAP